MYAKFLAEYLRGLACNININISILFSYIIAIYFMVNNIFQQRNIHLRILLHHEVTNLTMIMWSVIWKSTANYHHNHFTFLSKRHNLKFPKGSRLLSKCYLYSYKPPLDVNSNYFKPNF